MLIVFRFLALSSTLTGDQGTEMGTVKQHLKRLLRLPAHRDLPTRSGTLAPVLVAAGVAQKRQTRRVDQRHGIQRGPTGFGDSDAQ